jgi:hypothetical protein
MQFLQSFKRFYAAKISNCTNSCLVVGNIPGHVGEGLARAPTGNSPVISASLEDPLKNAQPHRDGGPKIPVDPGDSRDHASGFIRTSVTCSGPSSITFAGPISVGAREHARDLGSPVGLCRCLRTLSNLGLSSTVRLPRLSRRFDSPDSPTSGLWDSRTRRIFRLFGRVFMRRKIYVMSKVAQAQAIKPNISSWSGDCTRPALEVRDSGGLSRLGADSRDSSDSPDSWITRTLGLSDSFDSLDSLDSLTFSTLSTLS